MTCRVYVGEYQDRITGAAATAYVVIDENGRLVKAMAQKVKTNKGLSLQAVKLAVQGLCYLHGMDEAMLCIRTHADPKTVQTILRHANVSTTLNIYAKVFDSTQMEAIGRVQASLENMLKESCSSSAQV